MTTCVILVTGANGGLGQAIARAFLDAARQAARARAPMRRFGQPSEVAAAIRFLACPEAGYITGSALIIDGGIL